jgi:hypothetical protein
LFRNFVAFHDCVIASNRTIPDNQAIKLQNMELHARIIGLPDALNDLMTQNWMIIAAAIDNGFDAVTGDGTKRFRRRQATNIKLEHGVYMARASSFTLENKLIATRSTHCPVAAIT